MILQHEPAELRPRAQASPAQRRGLAICGVSSLTLRRAQNVQKPGIWERQGAKQILSETSGFVCRQNGNTG